MPELTIVIPALNEEVALPKLLDDLASQRDLELEVVVADGGSLDATVPLARRRGAIVVETRAGRARQMNAGAEVATSQVLLFLHADTRIVDDRLLANALAALRSARERRGARVAGHFSLRFDAHDGTAFNYRYLERKTELNRPNTTNGDQGIMIGRDFFDEVGGFEPDLPFLEDQRFARSVRERGGWITLPGTLQTSARRFETEGFGRRYLLMAIIMGTFDAGVDSFFEEAPELYARHHETGELDLAPYFRHIWGVTRGMGPKGAFDAWLKVGRFIRRNAWQIPFALDVWLEEEFEGEAVLTEWFDREIADRIEGPGWDLLTAVLSAAAFMVVFPALYGVNVLRGD